MPKAPPLNILSLESIDEFPCSKFDECIKTLKAYGLTHSADRENTHLWYFFLIGGFVHAARHLRDEDEVQRFMTGPIMDDPYFEKIFQKAASTVVKTTKSKRPKRIVMSIEEHLKHDLPSAAWCLLLFSCNEYLAHEFSDSLRAQLFGDRMDLSITQEQQWKRQTIFFFGTGVALWINSINGKNMFAFDLAKQPIKLPSFFSDVALGRQINMDQLSIEFRNMFGNHLPTH